MTDEPRSPDDPNPEPEPARAVFGWLPLDPAFPRSRRPDAVLE
jgi:hypothetical protein